MPRPSGRGQIKTGNFAQGFSPFILSHFELVKNSRRHKQGITK